MSSTAAASPRGNRRTATSVSRRASDAKLVSKNALPLGRPMATKSAWLHAPGGKGAGATVGPALQLLPGQRVGAMADRHGILRLAFGIPARHIRHRNQHTGLPSPGFLKPAFCGERRAKSRPPRLFHLRGDVVTQCGRAVQNENRCDATHNLAQVCRECGAGDPATLGGHGHFEAVAIRRAFPMNNALRPAGRRRRSFARTVPASGRSVSARWKRQWACMGWP